MPLEAKGSERETEKVSNSGYLDRFSRFVDRNKRIITYGLYGVCGVGGLLVLRSLRVFRQFKSVAEIPEEFVEHNHSLFGYVEKCEVVQRRCGVVPRVTFTHIPIYGKYERAENCQIPVLIPGVRLHPGLALLGSKTLTDMAVNKKVKVTLFGSAGEELEGKVCLKKFLLWRNCLGETLVKQGLAEIVHGDLERYKLNSVITKYRTNLEISQARAKKKKVGWWKISTDKDDKSPFLRRIISLFKSRE